ncbi:preprotein translocase subunit SecY [Actinokineospora sp. HUAS TT18]|uniref:preprotein translocase subunit SecY n=1 Tax=Actinokineospora sp. HUAS TT18 TaxID=3447451 RepID=UPI003F51F5CF
MNSPAARVWITVLTIAAFRVGQGVPLFNADPADTRMYLVDLLTGGGLLGLSLITFGVTPMFIARALHRRLRARDRVDVRWLTVGIGAVGGVALAFAAPGDWVDSPSVGALAIMALLSTAGTVAAILLADLITRRGVGDGARLLLLSQILTVAPVYVLDRGVVGVVVVAAVAAIVVPCTIMVAQAQRRVPIQYRRMSRGTATYLPLRVAQPSGTLLAAAAVVYVPALWQGWEQNESDPARVAVYVVLVCVFAFVRSAATFDPSAAANSLARAGGFVPGIRPGQWTADYLGYVHTRINAAGALYLGTVALLAEVAVAVLGAPRLPFAGPAIVVCLIFAVDVTLETAKHIESHRAVRKYAGFLR